jgi:HEXXH motif-containing protein
MLVEGDLTAFDPSRWRGEAVNARMRKRLDDSLRYIIEQADGHVAIPHIELRGFFDRLKCGPVSPLVFGAYCDLVLAFEADDFGTAERLLCEIATAPNVEDGPHIVDLAEPEADAAAERYVRLVDTDPDAKVLISPPGAASCRLRALIGQAFAMIDAGNPALGAEIRAIVREIVLAHGAEDTRGLKFDGVSSFLLWGGVVLNVEGYSTALELVQALAHESGHNLLFGLCAHGPLQSNGDSERHPSPLRTDLRPMDGIVHATYVTARMHQSVQRLLDGGLLDQPQRREAEQANVNNVQHFVSGLETVDRCARLTPLGEEVMAGAQDYMRAYL